jgi:hypothetical protein
MTGLFTDSLDDINLPALNHYKLLVLIKMDLNYVR